MIVGLSSSGQATYEDAYNGGMGSNGLTSARHDVFGGYLAGRYPESYDPIFPPITGLFRKQDTYRAFESVGLDAGKLVLSPTRTYAPVIREVVAEFRNQIGGMIHCSGGAQTKVLHFADKVHIIKDNLFPCAPSFQHDTGGVGNSLERDVPGVQYGASL